MPFGPFVIVPLSFWYLKMLGMCQPELRGANLIFFFGLFAINSDVIFAAQRLFPLAIYNPQA